LEWSFEIFYSSSHIKYKGVKQKFNEKNRKFKKMSNFKLKSHIMVGRIVKTTQQGKSSFKMLDQKKSGTTDYSKS